MTKTYGYDAFGTLTEIRSLNAEGVLAEAETALSRFLYAGEQYDAVTGLYYLRARQYDTVAGRFTQEDTYLGDGRNLYVYVQNNPLKYVDPSGYCRREGIERMRPVMLQDRETPMIEDDDGIYAVADFYTGIKNNIHEQAVLIETSGLFSTIAMQYPFDAIEESIGAGIDFTFSKKTIVGDKWNYPLFSLGCFEMGAEIGRNGIGASAMASLFKTGVQYNSSYVNIEAEVALFSVGRMVATNLFDRLEVGAGIGMFWGNISVEVNWNEIQRDFFRTLSDKEQKNITGQKLYQWQHRNVAEVGKAHIRKVKEWRQRQ